MMKTDLINWSAKLPPHDVKLEKFVAGVMQDGMKTRHIGLINAEGFVYRAITTKGQGEYMTILWLLEEMEFVQVPDEEKPKGLKVHVAFRYSPGILGDDIAPQFLPR